MKRLITLLLALALAVSCAACASSKGGDEATAPTKPPYEPPYVGEGVYTKLSYSVADDVAISTGSDAVATVGGAKLTNGLLQIYYWSEVYNFLNKYGSYALYYGLDLTKPLDEQSSGEQGTWQHTFLENALNTWATYQAMAEQAKKASFQMPANMQEELDKIEQTTLEQAKEMGYSSIEAMLKEQMGAGVTFEDFYAYQEVYLYSFAWYEHLYKQLSFEQADIDKYFTEHEEDLNEQGITKESGLSYSVRHILVPLEGGTKDENNKTTYSDADWENCRVKAQGLLDEWLAGEATEDSFAAMANEHSTDGGSNTNGGLYEGLNKDTNFVPNFKNWYLDETRKPGDSGLVTSDYGYHIMYFSGSEPAWIYTCREALMSEAANKFIADAAKAFPMDCDYTKIALGVVDLEALNSGDQ